MMISPPNVSNEAYIFKLYGFIGIPSANTYKHTKGTQTEKITPNQKFLTQWMDIHKKSLNLNRE